ncbi:sigma-70 family RNA polymerase sigma factor [Paracrocinitomix mangrovi]|uniref:RNA polymerase sigma factor n=1 Tax=Paracrocinitomix mangrovi TaxID=2862509 RepID=UPI001C8E7901|nr:sigma-70 family RNA polymerase sigma factor [Paracrocinitomix mangrovi]UKN00819.1 sigma-70 family RNA polymerase sigma factor [Paracrocinitomix mangrovi]
MTDEKIIAAIRNGKREAAIKELYKEYPKVRVNILSSGGDEEIAREIFHDSLILLMEKVSKKDFELTSKLSTFLYGINRFLWKNELRKRQRSPELEWKDTLILTADDVGYNEEKEEKIKALNHILNQVTEKCKQIFELFYFKKENMNTIAEKLGFTSVNSAKTQKYKCMEKAIKLAKETQTQNA